MLAGNRFARIITLGRVTCLRLIHRRGCVKLDATLFHLLHDQSTIVAPVRKELGRLFPKRLLDAIDAGDELIDFDRLEEHLSEDPDQAKG